MSRALRSAAAAQNIAATSATGTAVSSVRVQRGTDASARNSKSPSVSTTPPPILLTRRLYAGSGASIRSTIDATVPLTRTAAADSAKTPPNAAGAPKPALDRTTPTWFHAKPPKSRERTISSPAQRTGSTMASATMRQAYERPRTSRQAVAESQPNAAKYSAQ